jgi:hypothetical protein
VRAAGRKFDRAQAFSVARSGKFDDTSSVASPNYSGEKRRKDLARQAKKKEKLARKLDKNSSSTSNASDYTGIPEPENSEQKS